MSARGVVITAAAGVAVIALAVTAREQPPSSAAAEVALGARLDDIVAEGVPGALVLVTNDSRESRVARGVRSTRSGTKLRTTDRFRAGSTTKMFVAALVLQLVDEGAIELDAPVSRWLPEFGLDQITVRQLLSHTSGLSDYVDDRAIVAGPDLDPEALAARALARPPLARPGERYAYSSTNYLLLGLLVERVTGETLAHELETRLFRPLGLTQTTFEAGIAELEVAGHVRSVHDGIASGDPRETTGESAAWAWSAGAVVSDADDLAAFTTALLDGRVVERSLLREAVPASGYGLGIAAFPTHCGAVVGHTGNVEGYVSVVWVRRSTGGVVVFMANVSPVPQVVEADVHALLEDAICGTLE